MIVKSFVYYFAYKKLSCKLLNWSSKRLFDCEY